MIELLGNFFSSPIGVIILAFIAIYTFIKPIRLFILKRIIRMFGPIVRSIKKEPQRLIASVYLSLHDLNKEGIVLAGLLERKQNDPIIYPKVKVKTSDKSLKILLNTDIPPIPYKTKYFKLGDIKFEEIEKIKDDTKIIVKFSCVDDLVEAKINTCEIDLAKAIENHKISALKEIKKILNNKESGSYKETDSFDDVREIFISKIKEEDESKVPNDVFQFLLLLRQITRKMEENNQQ